MSPIGELLWGGIHDDLLGTTFQVQGSLILGGEDTGGLDDIVGTSLTPGDVGRVTLLVHFDGLAVDDEVLFIGGEGDVTLEVAVGGVVLQHVDL